MVLQLSVSVNIKVLKKFPSPKLNSLLKVRIIHALISHELLKKCPWTAIKEHLKIHLGMFSMYLKVF